jgi:hypothetical protein
MSLKSQKLWSLNALANELGRNMRTVTRAMRDVRPDGQNGRHPVWRLSTALRAMQDYERKSDRFPAAVPDMLDEIEEASAEVHDMFERMHAEPDVERRRKILEEHGRCVGRLHRAIEADIASRDEGHRALFGPWARDQFAAIAAETLSLCQWRLELEDGTIWSPPELISDERVDSRGTY